MDSLIASYGGGDASSSSSSDSESELQIVVSADNPRSPAAAAIALPPPPIHLLNPPNSLSLGSFDDGSRIRSFPHIEGNYALHVYIPVLIPSERKKELAQFLKKATSLVPALHVVDIDVPLLTLIQDQQNLLKTALGREFHISLGRTVPIRVHQIDSVVAMLRNKLPFQKRYLIDFDKWEVFVNDDHTRTFLSIENTSGGLPEITKQIQAVNEVYRLHNLPEFYKDPRPHISIAWAVGDISQSLKRVVKEELKLDINVGGLSTRCMFTCKFNNIVCKVGSKTYNICGSQGQ